MQLQQSKQREEGLRANISKFLYPDQLEKLKGPAGSKDVVWSDETIQRCLSIRSVVGSKGYEYLRSLGFPLPSYRTLCRKVENLPFSPGIQHDVLQLLKDKMRGKSEYEKLCVLLVDEMQLKPRVEVDKSLKEVVGYVSPETLPDGVSSGEDRQIAVHALVFMLRGLTSSWKQTVAYLFTGTTLNTGAYWTFTKQVLDASEAAGLKVQCITSDMGPVNTALWKHVGILSTRHSVVPSIPHPVQSDHCLYFVADPPHLLKNLWNCVLVHQITLTEEIVSRYQLPVNLVNHVYVQQLIDLQQSNELRVAHKLHSSHVRRSQYEKM